MHTCTFTEQFLDSKCTYQQCSCGKHVWSGRSKRIVLVNDREYFKTSHNGKSLIIYFKKNVKLSRMKRFMNYLTTISIVIASCFFLFSINHYTHASQFWNTIEIDM